jgi:hypothetical protein
MTKRVTPAVTAIGVITVSLLVAGGSRLSSTTAVSAAGTTPVTVGQIAVNPATLPPDGQSVAQVTVAGGQACASGLLGGPSATFATDGSSLFSTSQTGPWSATIPPVNFDNQGNAVAYIQATSTPGIENVWATLNGGGGLLGLGGSGGCSGQTPNAQLTEVGTPASIVLDAPNPARVQTGTGTVAVTAHVLDASNFPVPGQTVVLFRSSAPTTQIPMTDAGGGNYTASIPAMSTPQAEQLVAFDATPSPALQSAPQTLKSVSSNADCTHTGLQFNPGSIIADGQSTTTAKATFFNGSAAAPNEPVTFTGDPGLNITNGSQATDQNGVGTAIVHAGYSIGNKKVTVTDPNSLISCSGTLVITNGTPGTPGPGQLSRFIYRAYNDVLHRVGEDAGVEYYGNFVNFGGSRGQVALAFTDTQEYLTDVVNGMYSKILGRAGETDGVTYWVGQLQSGNTTDEQLAALFLSSDEFYANNGGSDSGFIDGLYQTVLGRPADAAGKQFWLNALQNGWTRTQVAYSYTDSNEQLANRVVGYYQSLLHRAPNSQTDIDYWVNAIQNGVHDENVMAAFIGSDEYFNAS